MRTKRNGAWGPAPLDSDGARDWLEDNLAGLDRRIRAGLRSKWPEKQRAAAYLLERIGRVYPGVLDQIDADIDLAVEKLKALLDNKAWMEEWDRDITGAVKRSIREQISALEKLRPPKFTGKLPKKKAKKGAKTKIKWKKIDGEEYRATVRVQGKTVKYLLEKEADLAGKAAWTATAYDPTIEILPVDLPQTLTSAKKAVADDVAERQTEGSRRNPELDVTTQVAAVSLPGAAELGVLDPRKRNGLKNRLMR